MTALLDHFPARSRAAFPDPLLARSRAPLLGQLLQLLLQFGLLLLRVLALALRTLALAFRLCARRVERTQALVDLLEAGLVVFQAAGRRLLAPRLLTLAFAPLRRRLAHASILCAGLQGLGHPGLWHGVSAPQSVLAHALLRFERFSGGNTPIQSLTVGINNRLQEGGIQV